jgi:hypothetical protein
VCGAPGVAWRDPAAARAGCACGIGTTYWTSSIVGFNSEGKSDHFQRDLMLIAAVQAMSRESWSAASRWVWILR